MKIALFDPDLGRFTADMQAWWIGKGYEVKVERYYDPNLVDWADVIWFFTCDNNLHVATMGLPDHPDWPLSQHDMTGKQVIVQAIDIECWVGCHANVDWSYVDDVIFIAPHIRELVEKDVDFARTNTRVHLIPNGVNLDRFPFVDKPFGKKIAWVCEKWPTKGIDYALQIMAMLPGDYELHALGRWNDRYAWEKAYQEDFIERHGIKFYDYEWVDNVADFLADKDFILSCSKKEAFGYSIAEGMAMGLAPIVHRFYGADAIWPGLTWDTVDEAVEQIQKRALIPDPHGRSDGAVRREYRDYLETRWYTLEKMMERFEEVIHGKD